MRDWTDLATDGRRLNRIIRILEKRMKRCEDDTKIVHYANSISILTREKVNISKLYLGIEDILKKVEIIR